MIDLDQLIASTAPDVMPTPDVVVRHRAMLSELAELAENDQCSSGRRAVELDPSPWRARGRLRPIVFAVAMLVAVIGGLVLLSSREPTPDAPATSSTTTTSSTISTPGLVTWEPTLYPLLPSEAAFGSASSAVLRNSLVGGNQRMVIGRLAGGSLTDIALIAVTDGPQDDRGWPGYTPLDAVTIDGVEVERWELYMTDSPEPFQRAQWRPDLAVSATDVAALLEEIGPASFRVLPDSGSGYPDIEPLPEGFVVLIAPVELPEATAIAQVQIRGTQTGDAVPIESVDAVPGWMFGPELVQQGATQADINGSPGWLAQVGTLYSVGWPVDEQTWFVVSSSPSAERALEIARSVEPVDRTTWFERYPEASSTAIGS
jgi:hypothetical protein